jgi:hypothetical protein
VKPQPLRVNAPFGKPAVIIAVGLLCHRQLRFATVSFAYRLVSVGLVLLSWSLSSASAGI